MNIWQLERATIAEIVHALASEKSAPPKGRIKWELISALWQGLFEDAMVLQPRGCRPDPVSRDLLRDYARVDAGLWNGNIWPEVATCEAGMDLGAWLRRQYPTVEPDTIDRMVNGYPPAQAEPGAERRIFLNGMPATLDAKVSEGDRVSVPAVLPFVANLSFDALASLPLTAYGDFEGFLDNLIIETSAIKRWHEKLDHQESRVADIKAQPHDAAPKTGAYSSAKLRCWYVDRVKNWPDGKTPPNRQQDWEDAKREAGARATKQAVTDLRRDLAPASWTKQGRRPGPTSAK